MHPLMKVGLAVGAGIVAKRLLSGKPKVFVSFDYDNDRNYKRLLEAWNANERFDFEFEDASCSEIDSNNVGVVKAVISRKINEADVVLVLVGKYANTPHRNRRLIGERNWIVYEAMKALELEKPIVAVKLHPYFQSPDELKGVGASWAMRFGEKEIIAALEKV